MLGNLFFQKLVFLTLSESYVEEAHTVSNIGIVDSFRRRIRQRRSLSRNMDLPLATSCSRRYGCESETEVALIETKNNVDRVSSHIESRIQ